MPLPFLLAAAQLGAAAAPSIFKGITGLIQGNKKVVPRDTTPAAFRESLAMTRAAAASNRLPGHAEAENRIAQGTAAVNAGALRAGGSSSDVLAALAASDAQQKQALSGLTTQATAYQQQQQGALHQALMKQAAYQKADLQDVDKERADLSEASTRNLYGAVDGLGQLASYAIGKYGGDASGTTPPIPGSTPTPRKRPTRYGATGQAIPEGLWGLMG